MDDNTIDLADGRSVPASAVAALDELERRWPGATLPQARPAIVAAVRAALDDYRYGDGYRSGVCDAQIELHKALADLDGARDVTIHGYDDEPT